MIIAARLYPALQGILLLLALQLPIGLLVAIPARAATFTVNSNSDTPYSSGMCNDNGSGTCTLRAAIQLANSSADTADIITLRAGTYILDHTGTNENAAATGDLDITSDITINGAGTSGSLSSTTTIDGNATDRVFHIHSGGKLTLTGVIVQNGRVSGGLGGGIYNEGGTATLDQVVITNNKVSNASSAGGNGGGIYNGGTMTLSNCTVSSNTADTSLSGGGGGGAYNFGTLTISHCDFDGNQTINSVLNDSNTPGGGALQNEGVSGIGSSISSVIIDGSTFTNNTAFLGGAIRNLFGDIKLNNSEISNNTASLEGGGIESTGDSSFEILSSVIRNNSAQQNGGGINNLGNMKITNSAIYGNQSPGINLGAGGAGGGIYNGGNGVLTLISTTVSQNSARLGGGMYNHAKAGITNATLYDNSASSTTVTPNGSELFACGSKDETLGTDCSANINDSSGVQIIDTQLVNTIIGNGGTSANCGGDLADLIKSNGHNLETADTCGFGASGDQRNVSPVALFNGNGLAFNGGALASLYTFALPTNSPAHNAADKSQCPDTDERGFKRIETVVNNDGCDIGAYEISNTVATSLLDLALDIQYKNGVPQNASVQTTITLTVANTSSTAASNVVLTIKIPTLSWLNVTSLGAESSSGTCTKTTDGVTCTIPSLDAFKSTNFFIATTASQSGAFTVDGDVESDQKDNYHPDNQKSVTITIPTVSGSSSGGNNFGGSSGGGGMDWLSLSALLIPAMRRLRRQ